MHAGLDREQDSDPYKRADKMVQDIMNVRTTSQFEAVIQDAAPDNLHAIPRLVRSLAPCTPLDQLIIRPGESGGMLTQAEYQLARFCSEEKLKKRTADRLIRMIKQRAFVIEDIRAETIREIEKMISDSSSSKILEYDLRRECDGVQEVKVYLRSLRHIIADLLRHLGYRDLQYLHFEYKEMHGERIFGPANGGIWWQITVRKIGEGHVLIALIVFQDGSWVN